MMMKRIISLVISLIMITEITFGYTSTIKINGFGGSVESDEGSTVVITPKVNIEGWNIKSGNVTVTNNQFVMPGSNIEIEGIVSEAQTTYTISYNANGGTGAPANQTDVVGETSLSSVTPEWEGHIFLGWSTSSTAETAQYSAGGSYTVTGDVTLYAVWSISSYTLTVNPGGATYGGDYNTTKQITAPVQSNTVTYNYNGSGQSNSTATANKTFTSWTKTGGGSISSTTANPTTYTYGTSNGTLTANYTNGSVTLPSATRDGYSLLGWSENSTSDTATYQPGASITVNGNITLYAIWKSQVPTLAESDTWYTQGGTTILRSEITSIEIKDSYTTGTYVDTWDASDGEAGTVTAYIVDDGLGNGTYKLILAGNGTGKIYANEDSSSAFSDSSVELDVFENVTSIIGFKDGDNVVFDTTNVRYMDRMFELCDNLESIDVSGFDTSNVIDMNYMFAFCGSLESLDLSGFDTSNVIDMYYMISDCGNLESINVSGFDTSNVEDMSFMFVYCPSLQSIDVSGFDTSNVSDADGIIGMFGECTSLTEIKLGENFGQSTNIPEDWLFYVSDNVNTIVIGANSVMRGYNWSADNRTVTFESKVNEPALGTELTPVNWNGTAWVETDVANWDYNYRTASTWSNSVGSSSYGVEGDGTARWANAQTADGSIYVWIPRFTYYTVAGNSVSWNADTAGTARTYILFSDDTNDFTTDSSGATAYTYNKHSAFTLTDASGNKTEITGFWIGKYEASKGTSNVPQSKPGVSPWTSIVINDIYTYGKDLNGTNTAIGAHMLKDSEWGAVALLTSAKGRVPYINNYNGYTGYAGTTQDASSSDSKYLWNTENGVRGSTTHNVYGVYDMNGGKWEYTAAFYSGSTSSYHANLTTAWNNYGNKYVDEYTTTSPTGDNAQLGWDNDGSMDFNASSPVPVRGGRYLTSSDSGIFELYRCNGYGSGYTDRSFRVGLFGVSL